MRRVQHTILAVDVLIRTIGGGAVHRGGRIIRITITLLISTHVDRIDAAQRVWRCGRLRWHSGLIPELVGWIHLENGSLQKHSLLHITGRQSWRWPLVALVGAQI